MRHTIGTDKGIVVETIGDTTVIKDVSDETGDDAWIQSDGAIDISEL